MSIYSLPIHKKDSPIQLESTYERYQVVQRDLYACSLVIDSLKLGANLLICVEQTEVIQSHMLWLNLSDILFGDMKQFDCIALVCGITINDVSNLC